MFRTNYETTRSPANPNQTPQESRLLTSISSTNRLKKEALDYAYKIPSKKNLKFNKPQVTGGKLKFDSEYYSINSPNNYKLSYCNSTFCRDYKKPKILSGIFQKNVKANLTNKIDNFFSKVEEQPNNKSDKISFKSLYNSKIFNDSDKDSRYTNSQARNKLADYFEKDFASGYKNGKNSLSMNVKTINQLRELMKS